MCEHGIGMVEGEKASLFLLSGWGRDRTSF